MSLIYTLFNYWKSIFVALCIMILSFAGANNFSEIPTFQLTYPDKIVHLIMYAVLALALMIDYRRSTKTNRYSIYFVLCCFASPVIFGGVIEIVQSAYFPPRTGDWFDWLADIAGVLIVWMGWLGRERIVCRKRVN